MALSSHQKLSLGIFIVFGTATFVFGFMRLQKGIVLPFFRTDTGIKFKTAEEVEKERTEKLKTQDTDGDGINDYDELYVFRTSPFLEDSDSDGINDGDEIRQNSDPNCPKGKTCRQVSSTANSTPPPAGSTITSGSNATPTKQEVDVLTAIAETFGDPNTLTPEKIAEKLKTMPTEELRTFLKKLGIPEAALNKTDDATLRRLLQETLEEMAAAGQTPASTNGSGTP